MAKRLRDPKTAGDARTLLEHFDPDPGDALDLNCLLTDGPIARRFGTFAQARNYSVVDGLLAASAIERDLILVTRNTEDVAGTAARVL
ncbi:MAG: type II toxin-antitoxin system VapC family toxin, partial [Myxococcota bacterium]